MGRFVGGRAAVGAGLAVVALLAGLAGCSASGSQAAIFGLQQRLVPLDQALDE
jgi:hypothetical protein